MNAPGGPPDGERASFVRVARAAWARVAQAGVARARVAWARVASVVSLARVAGALALVLGGAVVAAAGFVALPLPAELLARRESSSLRILDARGALLRELRGADGRSVPLDVNDGAVPAQLRAAFVAAEDQRFGAHPGVDLRAIARAVRDSVAAGEIVSGASTIPQQLARRLVPRERTFAGKAKEALWALRLTAHLDDEALLVEYLNRVPLGRGTVGVEAAADAYFGKPARALSLAEAALLAGLAHAPSREDPFRHPARALARRRFVLDRMRALSLVSADQHARAVDEPLELAGARPGQRAPHFVDALLGSLDARGLGDAVQLHTTIDPALQAAAERIVVEELGGPLERAGVGQSAVVVLDNATGAVLAYVGSRDWRDTAARGMNDGVRSRRQPGSALKPFVYGMALARGMTASTILPDVELTMATESGTYAPRNYDKRVHGPVRLRAALQNSYNIPAVHLAEELGPRRVLDGLRAAGFLSLDESPEHYGVGIVLGNGDVTLLELARAYRGLARGGVLEPSVDVVRAMDGAGRTLIVAAPFSSRRFLDAPTTALLTDIMMDGDARAPAFGVDNALDLPFPVAAKTGTSRAYVDNWTAGFTAERTVAVWSGNFDGTPMRRVSGITGAGTIFRRVMIEAMRDVTARGAPAPLVDRARFDDARVCPLSGQLASPACPGALAEVYLPGTAPRESCTAHVHGAAGAVLVDLAPRYRPWARAEGMPLSQDAAHGSRGGARAPRLLSPADGDVFVREPGLPAGQGVPVKIDAPDVDVVEIRVDGAAPQILRIARPHATWLELGRGAHHLVAVDTATGAPLGAARFTVH